MLVWDIYDEHGTWLGTVEAFNESEALDRARAQGMSNAASASPCEE